MRDLSQQMQDLAQHVSVHWADREVELALAGLHRRARRRRRRRIAAVAIGAALIAFAALQGAILLRGPANEPSPSPRLAQHPAAAPAAANVEPATVSTPAPGALQRTDGANGSPPAAHVVTLPDGSRFRALTPQSKVRIASVSPEQVDVELSAGAVRFEVAKAPHRRFRVAAGQVEVVVLGTTFSVARETAGEHERVQVAVFEGRVRVHWQGQRLILGAGDSRWFSPPTGVSTSGGSAQSRARRSSTGHKRQGPRGSSQGWRALATQGLYSEAFELLGADADAVRDEPQDLFLAADSARLAGKPGRALPYLRRILDKHAQDPRAPLAAFTIGRIQLARDRPALAAGAFATVQRLERAGPLTEDALAREVQAWSLAGKRARARVGAERYLQRYPKGRHAASVRRWAGLPR